MGETPNPFVIGRPLDHKVFEGRNLETTSIFDAIDTRSHRAIYGGPGTGRTSLLRFVGTPAAWRERGRDPEGKIFVYLNCRDIHPFTQGDFFRAVLTRLRDKAGDDAPLCTILDGALAGESTDPKKLRPPLLRALRRIGEQDRVLALLVDDYDDALQENPGYPAVEVHRFVDEMRSLAVGQEESPHLSTVVASLRKLSDQGPAPQANRSPWYNHYLFLCLRPFDEREAYPLLYRLSGSSQVPWQAIRDLSGHHPTLLAVACHLFYEVRRQRQPPEVFLRKFMDAAEPLFKSAWSASSAIEKTLLMMLALSRLSGRLGNGKRYTLDNVDILLSQKERELNDLEQRGVLRREGGGYTFVSSLMEWWVVKEIEASPDEAALMAREEVLLGLSRQQVEQVKGVMREVWQRREAMKAAVKWCAEVFSPLVKTWLTSAG